MTYRATDDDLPATMWPDTERPERATMPSAGPPVSAEGEARHSLARSVAAQLHYPEVKLTHKQQRDLDRDHRESKRNPLGTNRKQYVKLAKKEQMFDWLRDLERTFPGMEPREREFCEQLLAKFRKYTPVLAKWITVKQYQWLNSIAGKYLKLPRRT